MKTSVALAIVGASLVTWGWSSRAQAQAVGATGGTLTSAAASQNSGILLGESALLHLAVGAEAGYDSNVFYNDDPLQKRQSAILRVTPSAELTNETRDGGIPSIQYSLTTSLQYREYLDQDPSIRAQRAFTPTLGVNVKFFPKARVGFSVSDQFTRMEEAPYTATSDTSQTIIRDYNQAYAELRLSPGGGRIQTVLRYANNLSIYETDNLAYANTLGHELLLDGSWRWLPKTALFVQAAAGYIDYFDDAAASRDRHNSIPLRALAGLRGLMTSKLTVNLGAGYSTALYRGNGVSNPSGGSSVLVDAGFTHRPFLWTSWGLTYSHGFRNSAVIGDFYDLDSIALSVGQQLASLRLGAFGRYEYRRYHGLMAESRNDNVLQSGVQADYYIQSWFYTGISYSNMINRSNISSTTAMPIVGVNYTKHIVLGRIGITY